MTDEEIVTEETEDEEIVEEVKEPKLKKIKCECGYKGKAENQTGVVRCPVCHKE